MNATRIAVAKAKLPPCCVRVLPQDTSILILGTYKLEPNGTRHGSIEVYKQQDSINYLLSYPTKSAILDLKINPFNANILISAHSTGEIIMWKIDSEDNTRLTKIQEVQVFDQDPECLATSVVFSPVIENIVSVTGTDGSVKLVDLERGDITRFSTKHDFECWITNFGSQNALENVIFSGGDDAQLIAHDLREPSTSIFESRKIHDAGVVSILPSTICLNQSHTSEWKTNSPYELWTGSYDDHIKCIDLRVLPPDKLIAGYPPRVIEELNLGGGVWRLTPSPLPNDDRVLVNCMYDGARIVKKDGAKEFEVLKTFTGDHESICYGGDWIEPSKVITTSFYDGIVQSWVP
ncbi:BA75_02418T0 [Komagataella pastoris]|uniref:methylated diphthine methylhydrolase n=1 Tax=Komagataella pastoris TaxID=4922 RepID=A0A1B2JBL1_PICPA|nr:BA75_02418T0 [Komagataella pastoris]